MLHHGDEAGAGSAALGFLLVFRMEQMLQPFISLEFQNPLMKFLLAAVQATNKTVLERRDLKGEGEASLGQCEVKGSPVSMFNLYSQVQIVFSSSGLSMYMCGLATLPSTASKCYVSWRVHTHVTKGGFSSYFLFDEMREGMASGFSVIKMKVSLSLRIVTASGGEILFIRE